MKARQITWDGVTAEYDVAEDILMKELAGAVRAGRASRAEVWFIHSFKAQFPGAVLRTPRTTTTTRWRRR